MDLPLNEEEVKVDPIRKWKLGGAAVGLCLMGVLGLTQSKISTRFARDSISLDEDRRLFTVVPNVREESTSTSTTSAPNIFLFTVDDMGWNDIGYNSGDLSEATPYMKELSRKGIILTQYHSQPSCTPSRVTLMTGKFAYKSGFQNYELQYSDGVGVPLSHKMMPEFMKDIGYKTIGFGKWNIGHCNSRYLPTARGFDHFLGYLCPGHGYTNFNCGNSAGYKDMIEGWSIDGVHTWTEASSYLGTYDTVLYRDQSTAAIKKHFETETTTPLFMWLAHHGIHSEGDSDPIPPSDILTAENLAYLKVLKKRLDDVGSEALGYSKFFKMRMITATVLMAIDNALEQLVVALEEEGQMSNSVIFVNSDNGGDVQWDKGHPGNNYPLRSAKFSYFDGAIRVPGFVYAPGIIPKKLQDTKYHGMMHHVDLLTTFYSIGGGDVDDLTSIELGLDGVNQWDAIMGDTTSPRNEIVFNLPRSADWRLGQSATSEGIAIRVGNYKLLTNHEYDGWFSPASDGDFKSQDMLAFTCEYDFYTTGTGTKCRYQDYLFDMVNDPNELVNLFYHDKYDAIKEVMISKAMEYIQAQPEYGKIIPEFYEKANSLTTYKTQFEAHDYFIVPWECLVID